MKNIYTFIFIAASTIASAQNLEWARSMGGSGVDFGQAIAVDNAGNVYSTGLFANTADFDPGTGVFNLTSAGSWDIYIQKLDSAGVFLWAKKVGSTGDDRGLSIATDGIAVYLTGMFTSTVDFDPGPGTANLTSAGTVDVFVMKMDASGNFVWANRLGGSMDDHGNSIALDASSNVHITGYFTGNVNGIANLNSSGQTDIFILKISPAGNLLWSKKMGSTGLDEGNGITVSSSGNVYTTGTFQVTVDFNPGGGNFNLTCTGGPYWDIYIQKLDASGNFVWAKQIGSVFEDRGFALTTDAAENVYTTGYFSDVADFDPGTGVHNIASNSGGKDVFIQKLDAAGNFIWAVNVGGWLMDIGYTIDVDGAGNIYTAGFFQSMGDFDPGPAAYNLTATGGQDIFLMKLDATGNFVWALKFGSNITDNGYSCLTSANGSVYMAGFFGQTVDFDPGPGFVNLTATGANDVFIVKLNEISTPLPVELLSFTAVPVNNRQVKLNWTTATEINNDFFTIERSVNANNWEYVNRMNGHGTTSTVQLYETWDDYPYKGSSYYRLKQTDFDGRFSYSGIVAVNLTEKNEIVISMNQGVNTLTIFSGSASMERIVIYDATGRLCFIADSELNQPSFELDISNLMKGIYFITVMDSSGATTVKKIVRV